MTPPRSLALSIVPEKASVARTPAEREMIRRRQDRLEVCLKFLLLSHPFFSALLILATCNFFYMCIEYRVLTVSHFSMLFLLPSILRHVFLCVLLFTLHLCQAALFGGSPSATLREKRAFSNARLSR